MTRFADNGPQAGLPPQQPSSEVTGSLGSAPSARVDSGPIGSPLAAPQMSSAPMGAPQMGSQQVAYAPANQTYNSGSSNYGSGGYVAAPPPPAVPHTPPAPAMAAAGGNHVVTSGETLSSIGRRYNVSRAAIASANGLPQDAPLRIGQSLVIPGAGNANVAQARPAPAPAMATAPVGKPQQMAAATPAIAPAPGPAPLGTTRSAAPTPAAPPMAQAQPLVTPAVPAQPKMAAATPAAPAKVETAAKVTPAEDAEEARSPGAGPQFRAPVRGRVISGFGPKPGGSRNDGVNFAVPEGTAVRAAEDGTVAYSGNELKGYGNLVLIKHADGYVTAYAHNSELSVKKGDTVRRGQIIAKAGQSGGVGTPQLHFEIRKGSQPVDPSQYVAGL
ncbi:hypothetical protein GCM10007301_34800 [Azorhizobium oxalatiphilum]|uniref:LysM domain-containing protein n=1 Tax=Azorhizobium oxalatiphilum TaxID=980631 RepID=A0A917FD44_9HYPH|nr:M23 family metallopeptidase [Azorhizobium oxalatiphilum]GGF72059.1 hypothetical protein GCM10007301_34800 [Azorhizobium oxalatiphilum]